MFQISCVEWWAAILTYLWFKGCKNIMHHHRVLKYGANRHINFENCQYKLNYHLRLLWINCFAAEGPAYDTGKQIFQLFSDWRQEGKELENTCFKFPDRTCWSWANIQKKTQKVGFTGPDDDKKKREPIAESVDTLLQHSKMISYVAAIAHFSQ